MFNTENGLYEGETFVAADMLEYEDGVTTVAPPVHEAGFVPVFDLNRQKWTLMPVALARVQILGMKGPCHENVSSCSD
jgi:hypothetical protein